MDPVRQHHRPMCHRGCSSHDVRPRRAFQGHLSKSLVNCLTRFDFVSLRVDYQRVSLLGDLHESNFLRKHNYRYADAVGSSQKRLRDLLKPAKLYHQASNTRGREALYVSPEFKGRDRETSSPGENEFAPA